MSPAFWAEVHGASTHFPVALTFAALGCDLVAVAAWHRPAGRFARAGGPVVLAAAAASTLPAVVSGLVLTRGNLWGHGALRLHHAFVWPAFALLIAAAVWRWLRRHDPSRRGLAGFLGVTAAASFLIAAAARWGGELLQTFP